MGVELTDFCFIPQSPFRPSYEGLPHRFGLRASDITSATGIEMDDRGQEPEPQLELEPARKPARKAQCKPKKEVPVGRNELKKRRVVKSRMATDDKGYFGASSHSVPRRCKSSELLMDETASCGILSYRGFPD